MIKKSTALKMLEYYNATLIRDNKIRIRIGNYEYIFNADAVNYVGDGSEFLIASLGDGGWSAQGSPSFSNGVLTLDGASYLSRTNITLGGQDFQISGTVYENSNDMIARRKIFELYTNDDLNMSLYSSGAGKNLDLFVNCEGTSDNYAEPAILEREYNFNLIWQQADSHLTLYVDGEEIYSNRITGFSTAKTFTTLRLGNGIYHDTAYWLGTISDFKIFSGFTEV